ncbi:MAG: ACT domain-containing protein [Streptosporangiales bacterium]|nr:ACT domain-containing protein [Streptosporangiales bacterium]
MTLTVLPGGYAVCRLPPGARVPAEVWRAAGGLVSVTTTPRETSVVCPEKVVPGGAKVEAGWRVLEVAGPLDFGLTGVLASLTVPLADAGISVFALSTYDTDYLLVRAAHLAEAVGTLREAGQDVTLHPSARYPD